MIRKVALLSFNEETEDKPKFGKIKSAHDMMSDDPRLSRQLAINIDTNKVTNEVFSLTFIFEINL